MVKISNLKNFIRYFSDLFSIWIVWYYFIFKSFFGFHQHMMDSYNIFLSFLLLNIS